ncbi:MAG: DNA polymerase I [Lachnospiraceae bacterium]|nr:DNA polymerase I [Lachnospiraceae bacterium]
MKKLVLIDGHSIMHRAFYGVPDLTNSAGLHTNAVYGFLNIMLKFMDEEAPDYMAVAFDLSAPTFRHKMFDGYKGTRKPMPPELREQFPLIRKVLSAMGIRVVEQEGFEADDILGTLAKKAGAEGIKVSLVSGDRDLLQIADENILIRIPKTRGGRTEVEDYDLARLKEEYHATPQQFIQLKALMGDTSDNIPGVPKIGEKTAMGLMDTYGSIENIYANLESIEKKSIRESLRENRELCDLSLKLATIETNAPIGVQIEDTRVGELFNPAAFECFKELEFRNLLGRFEEGVKQEKIPIPETKIIEEPGEAKRIFAELSKADKAAFLSMPDGSLAITKGTESYLMLTKKQLPLMEMLGVDEGGINKNFLKEEMTGLLSAFEKEGKTLITFDVKKSYDLFDKGEHKGTSISRRFTDVKLLAYLMNPLKSEYVIEDVAGEYLSLMLEDYKKIFGKKDFADAATETPDKIADHVAKLLYTVIGAEPHLSKAVESSGQKKLYEEIERPLTYVLYAMEKEGILADKSELNEYSRELGDQIVMLEEKIYDEVGEKFNLNSPKQLGEILFEKMQIPGGKKTKTGYSTAADVLEKLAVDHPFVRDILEYRALAKLKSTYADGLADYIREDGRIHTRFNQMITATGRLSSTDPNLQNIPTRTEMGRRIRKVFKPRQGCIFLDADYSQIELRLLAHMSGDRELIEAYRQSRDIHASTAAKVFHVPFEEVTPLQRRNAKAVNFGIVYGISSFGLSQDLSITRKEAQQYIEEYFATYPGIKKYLDDSVASAKETGESRTLYLRRRPIPELASSNFMQRQFGERVAMNAPIQGTAADIMKIAMIRVFEAMDEMGLKSRMLLQVHDELLIETYPEEEQAVREILNRHMKGAADLQVDLEIDVHSGLSWYEAK